MAHVGKSYPRFIANDLADESDTGNVPPFRWRITSSHPAIGSLSQEWRDCDVVSEAGIRDPAGGEITWRCINSSSPSTNIVIGWKVLPAPLSTSFPPWRSYFSAKVFEYSTLLAEIKYSQELVMGLSGPELGIQVVNQWTFRYAPAKWNTVSTMWFHFARWVDVPWYHPYIHSAPS